MKKVAADESPAPDDEIRPEYDFRGGERGKYAERYARGTNVVLSGSDAVEVLSHSESVERFVIGDSSGRL